jgi:hypothetical protein
MLAAAVAVAVTLAAVALVAAGGEEEGARDDPAGFASALRSLVTGPAEELTEPSAAVRPPLHAIATVREGERVQIRRAPAGKAIATIGDLTEFGSTRNFSIARVTGDWLGVIAPELPNGTLGWIRDDRDRLEVFVTRFSLHADLSDGEIALHHGNRVVDTIPVTVGRPSSPTPVGDYAVTDALAGANLGPWYGCCVLALSGHQASLPPGWLGGDRVAIHGTPGAVGGAASSGCMRASNPDMVSLFARLPLGAPVFIRA